MLEMAANGSNVQDVPIRSLEFSHLKELSNRLDPEHSVVRCWVDLANEFRVPRDTIAKLRQAFHTRRTPSQIFFRALKASYPNHTVGDLKQKCKSLHRNDVVNYLSELSEDQGKLSDLPNEVFENLAVMFSAGNCVSTWEDLASSYNYSCSDIRVFSSVSENDNDNRPTINLIEHLSSSNPDLSIMEVVRKLRAINRNDAALYLENLNKDLQ